MARRARLLLVAAALAPLPLLAVFAFEPDADARRLTKPVVTVRDGNLWVGERQITFTGRDADPEWSPDHRRIAFVRQDGNGRTSALHTVRRDGGDLVRLTRARQQVVALPSWRGDGRLIAYAASPLAGGSFDVWSVPAGGGTPRLVAAGPAEQIPRDYAVNGRLKVQELEPGKEFPEKTRDTGTPRTRPRELLPDFDQRAPFRLTLAGTRLGFASATDNIGDGPVWVRGSRASRGAPMVARQLVRLSDGTLRAYDHAGRLRYTPESTHSHWHLLDFQRYELRTLEGDLVVRDRKSGFCLADHYGLAARRVAVFSGGSFYGDCATGNPGALTVEQGTSPGFTDLYPAHFHGQNLELRGVPAGVYVLVHRANPEERLEELDYTNNAASLRIRLTWSGGTPRIETLRRCESSARC